MGRIEKIGDCTLMLGDCLEILPTLGKFDLLLTDPPYGIGAIMKGGTWGAAENYATMDKWDSHAPQTEVMAAVEKASEAIVWGGNYFSLRPSRCWLVWDKLGSAPKMADVEMAWTTLDRVARKFSHHIENGFLRVGKDRHPTQKPVALMRWCLGFVPNAQTILDPFAGSGTTGVACVELGRKFVGIEIDPVYFDTACRRIEQAVKKQECKLPGFSAKVKAVQASLPR